MAKKDKVDIKNFMGVIKSTQQTEDGLLFPGAYMPSGNPVVGPGATLAMLMKDKGMAEQWHQSIVGQYESEKEQVNHERSKADTPDLVIGGQDGDADNGGGGVEAAAVHREEPKAELSKGARSITEELTARRDTLRVSYEDLAKEYFDLEAELKRVETALAALNEL